jgi:hypothetical protein
MWMSERTCHAVRPQFRDNGSLYGKLLLAGVAMVSILVLNACANAVRSISSQDISLRTGVLSTFAYAAADGEMNTVVIGNPFDIPKDALERVITETMQGNHYGPRTTFTTTPSADARAHFRVVMMFDRPRAMNRQQLCGPKDELEPEPRGDRLRLATAFCARNQLLSWVDSSIAAPASPDDPAFRNMIANAIFNLIPSRDHDPDGRDGSTIF